MKFHSEAANSILGQKLCDDSYPDGRIFCHAEYPAFLAGALQEVTIKVSYDQKKVWFLWPIKYMTLETIFGEQKVPKEKNDIHRLKAENILQEAIDQAKLKAEELAKEVSIPLNYTGEPLFEFPYQVNRHLVDSEGKKTKKVYFSSTSFRFWIQKTDSRTCGGAATEQKIEYMDVDNDVHVVEILKAKISKYEAEVQKWKDQALKTGAYLVQLKGQVIELESRIAGIEKEKGRMSIDEEERAALDDIIGKVKLQAKLWKGQALEAEEEIDQLKKQLKEVQEELASAQKEKDEMEVDEQEVQVLNERMANITSQAERWRDQTAHMEDQLQDLNKLLSSAEDNLQTAVNENESLKAQHLLDLENLNKTKKQLELEIDEATKKAAGLQLEIDMLRSSKEGDDKLMRELLHRKNKGEEDAALKLKYLQEENSRVHTQLEQKQIELDRITDACETYFEGLKGENEELRTKFEIILKAKNDLLHDREEEILKVESALAKQKEEEERLAKLGKRTRTDLLESEELRGALKQQPDQVQSGAPLQNPLPEVVTSNK